jgi:two-component system OmpR family response regulator
VKILLVEDNERVAQFVVKGLQEAGHTTDHAGNGRDGMFLAAGEPYDVIIMDRMLPGDIDGLAIIEVLRKAGKRTPILILSALSEVDDRIRGLRSGGDDYLTKPFAFGELLARIDALHRRAQGINHETPLVVGDLHMDPLTIISIRRPMWWMCTSANCGRKSTPRPSARCCARCAMPATR